MKIARESFPFVIVLGLLAAAAAWLSPWVALIPLALLAFTLWFFRDPERRTPAEPGALISPADGRIIRADSQRISVFMNVFNVHVCRAPLGGTVESVRHHDGKFLAAFKDSASEHNERTEILVNGDAGSVRFVLVAGLIARRIVCKIAQGQGLSAGQRIGVIQFGSRVDLDLPPGAVVATRVGSRVVAGETVVARLPEAAGGERRAPAP